MASITFQNYNGLDLSNLETILGSTEYAYVITKDPTERSSTGSETTETVAPDYLIDYSFKNPLILLVDPTTDNSTVFQNYFDVFSIDDFVLDNITHYNPSISTPLVLK